MVDTDMMNAFDFEALLDIGLGASMRSQLACGVADPAARPMRLLEVQREHLLLHDGQAARRARCSTALAHDLLGQHETLAVGDWVLARPAGPAGLDLPGLAAGWVVTCRLLPHSQITRRTNDGRGGLQRQALVSNVDTALLVMGLDLDFNLRRLERYLALVRLAGVCAVLVLSKADAVAPELSAIRLAQAKAVLPAGMAALALDLRQADAAERLEPWLARGQTLVLLGSSGAGKSTLANTLSLAFDAGATRSTRPVRVDDGRGRHTTTVRTLIPLPGAACIIDTPGLRALRLDLEEAGDLAEAFGDVARWAPACRFRDCQHRQEPGCAVRASVPEGRLRNYHKLLREAGRDGLSVLERRAQVAQWKSRSRNAQLRVRAKRESAT